MDEEDDDKTKAFLLPFQGQTFMFHYKRSTTTTQLFSKIGSVIPFYKKRPFILKYPLRSEDDTIIWITMTRKSKEDVRVLYCSAHNYKDVVKIMDGMCLGYIYYDMYTTNWCHVKDFYAHSWVIYYIMKGSIVLQSDSF